MTLDLKEKYLVKTISTASGLSGFDNWDIFLSGITKYEPPGIIDPLSHSLLRSFIRPTQKTFISVANYGKDLPRKIDVLERQILHESDSIDSADPKFLHARRHEVPLHTPEEKFGFSKIQSTTLICKEIRPTLFPRSGADMRGGVIFPIDPAYVLINKIFSQDIGTVSRPYDKRELNEELAFKSHKSLEELYTNLKQSNKLSEILARLKFYDHFKFSNAANPKPGILVSNMRCFGMHELYGFPDIKHFLNSLLYGLARFWDLKLCLLRKFNYSDSLPFVVYAPLFFNQWVPQLYESSERQSNSFLENYEINAETNLLEFCMNFVNSPNFSRVLNDSEIKSGSRFNAQFDSNFIIPQNMKHPHISVYRFIVNHPLFFQALLAQKLYQFFTKRLSLSIEEWVLEYARQAKSNLTIFAQNNLDKLLHTSTQRAYIETLRAYIAYKLRNGISVPTSAEIPAAAAAAADVTVESDIESIKNVPEALRPALFLANENEKNQFWFRLSLSYKAQIVKFDPRFLTAQDRYNSLILQIFQTELTDSSIRNLAEIIENHSHDINLFEDSDETLKYIISCFTPFDLKVVASVIQILLNPKKINVNIGQYVKIMELSDINNITRSLNRYISIILIHLEQNFDQIIVNQAKCKNVDLELNDALSICKNPLYIYIESKADPLPTTTIEILQILKKILIYKRNYNLKFTNNALQVLKKFWDSDFKIFKIIGVSIVSFEKQQVPKLCFSCGSKAAKFFRHHCRGCGALFCSKHIRKIPIVLSDNQTAEVFYCMECRETLLRSRASAAE